MIPILQMRQTETKMKKLTQWHMARGWQTNSWAQFSFTQEFVFDAVPIMNKFEKSTEVS